MAGLGSEREVRGRSRARALLALALLAGAAACTGGAATGRPMASTPGPATQPPPTATAASRTSSVETPAPVACPEPLATEPRASPDPIAAPAVDAVLALYEEVSIVAIGERHGWPLEHDFLAQLVCDPRFPGAVDDIVVEFGNSRLQPILDAYVNGAPVTTAELASVWRESTQRSGVWEHPVYARFFGLIRTVNAGLAIDDRVRVLAGDPPIDYATITRITGCSELDPSCYEHWLQGRDESFADVVAREAIARGRTALLIAGSGHMTRRTDPEHPASIPQLLEADHATPTLVVLPHLGFGQADPASEVRFDGWPLPGLARLDGTWLGALDACLLEADIGSPPDSPCSGGDGADRLADVADAYLYLGYP